jgi:hypothetical protein
VGNLGIFEIFTARVGYRFYFSRHVAAHVPFTAGIFKGKPFFYLLLPFLCFSAAATAYSSSCRFVLQRSIATSFPLRMRVKRLSQDTPMAKLSNKKQLPVGPLPRSTTWIWRKRRRTDF